MSRYTITARRLRDKIAIEDERKMVVASFPATDAGQLACSYFISGLEKHNGSLYDLDKNEFMVGGKGGKN